ncbi:MAG: hypothetical protein J6N55_00315 [Anaerovibrio sp.]|uniref:hypothetical protein n=1 Tax=Anaerovibrio sp. TaxID=1872532 RepID=UPI001B14357F|nr:hypothetical protein [Anaerovibrio sp.]MBO6244708.1 hypothetical protein [Anaerovibrio sp.]
MYLDLCFIMFTCKTKGATVSTNVRNVSVSLDATSKWILTDDTYISSFTGDLSQITANGHSLYVDGVKVL